MRKYLRLILSVILVLSIAFSASFCVFAEEGETPAEGGNTEAEEIIEDETDEPTEPSDDDIVMTMYLCATANSFTGHVWLYFTNESEFTLPLGYITLAPGKSMSVGSLRNTRKDGGGTYYNGEAYMTKDLVKLQKHTTSLKTELTMAELRTVNEVIKSHNLYILIGWNCGNFACKVWNSLDSTPHVTHIVFPMFTILSMLIRGAVKGDVLMDRPSDDEIFKQKKDHAEAANPKSFRTTCVG